MYTSQSKTTWTKFCDISLMYLDSRLENQKRENMRHLRCLCFVRPSPDSIQLLIDELREPKYGEYNLCKRDCNIDKRA